VSSKNLDFAEQRGGKHRVSLGISQENVAHEETLSNGVLSTSALSVSIT
jgi:hypothetical protein